MSKPSLALVGHDLFLGPPPESGVQANIALRLDAAISTLEWLQGEGFRFVGLAEFLAGRRRGNLALLTFDDAYANVCELMLPRLRPLGIPAVMFIVSETLTQSRAPFPLWLHALRDIRSRLDDPRFAPLLEAPPIRRALSSANLSLHELLSRSLPEVSEFFRREFSQTELQTIGDLAAAVDPTLRVTASRDQLMDMLRSGDVELGAHSATHRPFATLTCEEITSEIISSTGVIANFTGRPPSTVAFAYPYGAVTTHAERIVGEYCAAGFTCHNRPTSFLDRRSSLPRINLDARAINVVRDSRPSGRHLSWVREKTRLNVRGGPAWKLVGPVYRQFRRPRPPLHLH